MTGEREPSPEHRPAGAFDPDGHHVTGDRAAGQAGTVASRRRASRRARVLAQLEGAVPPDTEERALLDTLVDQTAAALERALLTREIVSTRTAAETERVRNTLLASISHDFRTPLSSILGSATSLIEYGDKLGAEARQDLLGHVKQEAEALDGMVATVPAPEEHGRLRQFVDRVFTIRGAGTVVTGTLTGARLAVGQEVEVYPTGVRARVRSLQTHKRSIDVARPV